MKHFCILPVAAVALCLTTISARGDETAKPAATTVPATLAASAPASEPASEPTTVPATDQDKVLAAEFLRLRQEIGNPAIEQINGKWGNKGLYSKLAGETPATAEELAAARKAVASYVELLNKGKDFPRPPTLMIARAKGKIEIDGRLDEDDWKATPITGPFYELNDPNAAGEPAQKTTLKMLWDDKYLYFGFTCEDSNLYAPKLKRDDAVYSTDCVELFLMPSARWGLYWELNVSASESIFDSLQCKDPLQWGCLSRPYETIHGLKYKAMLTGPADKPTGYVVEIAVPMDQLPCFTARAGATLHVMATRVDATAKPDGKGADSKFYGYAPIMVWFHNTACWPLVTLGE